jgi:LysM repeat protein
VNLLRDNLAQKCDIAVALVRNGFSRCNTAGRLGVDVRMQNRKTQSVIRLGIVSLVLLVASAPVEGSAKGNSGYTVKKVVVRAGDNLGRIAERHRVSVKDLRRWNRKRIGPQDRIRLGDMLTIRIKTGSEEATAAKGTPTWIGHYQVRMGDTLGSIAGRLHVSVSHLMALNNLRSSHIKMGQTLRYEKPGERPAAASEGRPTRGKLLHGRHLGKGRGYRLRFPNNAYGTDEVNSTLRSCAREVSVRFPGTAKLLIGDISRPTGGTFPPHSSHQSGRDADVGYYLGGNLQNKTLHKVAASHLDYAKNWTLLRCYLKTGRVVRLYMDTNIQKGYVRYLRRRKLLSSDTIDRLFGAVAPNPRRALVRHAPGHDTHLHVRFSCSVGDTKCAEEKVDSAFSL